MAGQRGPLQEEVTSANPLSNWLPSLFHDNDFALRFSAGIDGVLAPVFLALDSLPAYLDPRLAPEDFVEFLSEWVGLDLDPTWSLDKKREAVAQIAAIYRKRGTVEGLAAHIRLMFDVEPEIEETGGVAVSTAPGGALPGSPQPRLLVRLRVPDPSSVDLRRLEALVASSKPAHVPHQVEVVGA